MKKGDTIYAIDPCIIEGLGTPSLTIGRGYKVEYSDGKEFMVLDDDKHPHWFDKRGKQFFSSIKATVA